MPPTQHSCIIRAKRNILFKCPRWSKVMIAMFGLFAEVERDLISERTKEGLAAAKAKGKLLGRPKEALGTSKLGLSLLVGFWA